VGPNKADAIAAEQLESHLLEKRAFVKSTGKLRAAQQQHSDGWLVFGVWCLVFGERWLARKRSFSSKHQTANTKYLSLRLQEPINVLPIRNERDGFLEQGPSVVLAVIKPQKIGLKEEQNGVVGVQGTGGVELLEMLGQLDVAGTVERGQARAGRRPG